MSVELHHFFKVSPQGELRKLAAKRDLKPGIVLTVHDLTVGLESSGGEQSHLTFTDQEIDEVIGKRVITEIPSGALILKTMLEQRAGISFSHKVPKGFRAFLIKTQSRLPLETGDRVDLVSKSGEGGIKGNVFMEDKRVLALNRKEHYLEVLVALTPEDIRKMESHPEDGWFEVVLRNPQDESLTSLKKQRTKSQKARSIQIIEEG
jgi:Flp pilus assembly protein CpaB